jgi:hypothetical protein
MLYDDKSLMNFQNQPHSLTFDESNYLDIEMSKADLSITEDYGEGDIILNNSNIDLISKKVHFKSKK